MVYSFGVGVQSLGFRVPGVGFRVLGLWFRVYGLWFRKKFECFIFGFWGIYSMKLVHNIIFFGSYDIQTVQNASQKYHLASQLSQKNASNCLNFVSKDKTPKLLPKP